MTRDESITVLLTLMVSILLVSGTQRLRGKKMTEEPRGSQPRAGRELCAEKSFKCFPSVYAVCWHGIMLLTPT